MMARTHVAIGVGAAIGISGIVDEKITIPFLLAAAIGSALPDVDHPSGSVNQRILPFNDGITKMFVYILLAAGVIYMTAHNSYEGVEHLIYLVPIFIMIAISKHRGITHSLLGSVIMGYIATKLGNVYNFSSLVFPFMIGYVFHCIADYFNPQGIELFFPCRKNFNFPVFTIDTNGIIENALFGGFIILAFYLAKGQFISILSNWRI